LLSHFLEPQPKSNCPFRLIKSDFGPDEQIRSEIQANNLTIV